MTILLWVLGKYYCLSYHSKESGATDFAKKVDGKGTFPKNQPFLLFLMCEGEAIMLLPQGSHLSGRLSPFLAAVLRFLRGREMFEKGKSDEVGE